MLPCDRDFSWLCGDLDAALGKLIEIATREPRFWERGRPGKWTAGQHVAHVAINLARTADLFERAAGAMRAGTLPAPPRRDLLQRLFFRVVVNGGTMPRGARTVEWAVPGDAPEREATLRSIGREAGRHRQIGEPLGERCRDLWIVSPYITRWHYRLPEMVRMHAVHARHHRRLVEEAVRA
jgi:hypothetical protein